MRDPNTKYTGICNKWLAKDEDDGLISRDLVLKKEYTGTTSAPIGGMKKSKKKKTISIDSLLLLYR
jgi:hypothetical protein